MLTSTNAFLYVKILFWITVHQVALLFTIQSKQQNVTLFLFSAREMISVPLLMLDNGVCVWACIHISAGTKIPPSSLIIKLKGSVTFAQTERDELAAPYGKPWLQRQQSVHLLHVELHKHTGLYMVKIWLKIFNSCIYSEVVLKDSHLKWEKILHHSIFTAVFAKLPFFVLGITSVRFCFLLIWHYKKNKNTCCCQSLTHLRPNKNNQIFLEMYFMEIVFAFSIENSGIM